ncbi:hypothetical protein [Photorhabdus australis]|nr:hypothetical protein [Photorhabdus australis]
MIESVLIDLYAVSRWKKAVGEMGYPGSYGYCSYIGYDNNFTTGSFIS